MLWMTSGARLNTCGRLGAPHREPVDCSWLTMVVSLLSEVHHSYSDATLIALCCGKSVETLHSYHHSDEFDELWVLLQVSAAGGRPDASTSGRAGGVWRGR